MADVFVSYAHEDQDFVRRLVPLLEAEGLSVWWDHTIPPGKSWNEFIARGIEEAKACIIVWSTHSVASEWVQEEATLAKEGGKYLPMQIGPAPPPVGFRRIQAANLTGWDGDAANPQWRMLVKEAIALAHGESARPAPAPAATPSRPPPIAPAIAPADEPVKEKTQSKAGLIVVVALAAIAIGFGGWLLNSRQGTGGAAAPTSTAAASTAPSVAVAAAPAAPQPNDPTGSWKLLPISVPYCKMTGSLTIGPPAAQRLCTLRIEEACMTFTVLAEQTCTPVITGDRIKLTGTVASARYSDNEQRRYNPDNFTLTISGAEMKGTLDTVGKPATFSRQSDAEGAAWEAKAASNMTSYQARARAADSERRAKEAADDALDPQRIRGTWDLELVCADHPAGIAIPHLYVFAADGKWDEFHGSAKGTWTANGAALVFRTADGEYRGTRAANGTYSGTYSYNDRTRSCTFNMKRFR